MLVHPLHGATGLVGLLLVSLELALGAAVLAAAARLLLRQRLRGLERPFLPDADRPPAGLSRLVPIGAQVDEEVRRGCVCLDAWLRERRQMGLRHPGASYDWDVPDS